MRNFLVFMLGLMFMVVYASCALPEVNQSKFNADQKVVIDIAKQKAKELNYNIKEMEIVIDNQNMEWSRYLAEIKKWQPELIKPLENKDYVAVYYRPKKMQMGGDLWVFVDKQTGKVITVIQGD